MTNLLGYCFESSKFELEGGVLYYENPAFPGKHCAVVPMSLHSRIALVITLGNGRYII